ncbi:MAG: type VI secretion system baseplate subunit TssG [Candidatus Eisenbacteria bacterium]|nr:type VI secretion system baseplate subunit TssG [Candidatus Eisenbacteria bacterium]
MNRRFKMPDFLLGGQAPPVSGVLASLIELGADPELIEILPVGIFRAYRGHLVDVLPPPGGDVEPEQRIRVYVAERGVGDRLPEGFLSPLRAELIPDALFDAIAHKRIWRGGRAADGGEAPDPEEAYQRGLDGGRMLLRIVDRALRAIRRDLTLLPQRLSAAVDDPAISRWLLGRFGLERIPLPSHRARFLSQHLPGFAEAVGRRDEAEALAQRLIGIPVSISDEGPRRRVALPDAIRARTGRSRVGVDACLGAEMIPPGTAIVARIGPLPTREIEAILSDPDRGDRIRAVVEMLIPADADLEIQFVPPEGERALVLGGLAGGLLGRNSRIEDGALGPRSDARGAERPATRPRKGPQESSGGRIRIVE